MHTCWVLTKLMQSTGFAIQSAPDRVTKDLKPCKGAVQETSIHSIDSDNCMVRAYKADAVNGAHVHSFLDSVLLISPLCVHSCPPIMLFLHSARRPT